MSAGSTVSGTAFSGDAGRTKAVETILMLRAFVRDSLRTAGGRILFLASLAGYWLLYALSTGIIAYFSYNALSQVISAGGTNPIVVNFLAYWQYPANIYESGLLWFVTPNLMLSLLIGPLFFSTVLSLLFGVNMLIFAGLIRRRGSAGRSGVAGLASVIPAVFSGSCCYAPFGLIAAVSLFHLSVSQTGALYALSYTYQILDNTVFTLLMLFSAFYSYRKLGSGACCS
ncbi:MAG: hypothetical protein M1351_01095 [Candidatus Thermoplasmatota archaeon]|nr:hypothetical protein [Candidatus Thermoplasmatota archaeon]